MSAARAGADALEASERVGSRRGGGPRLERDEWVILLDIHLRHAGKTGRDRNRDMDQAVQVLSRIASRRGQARPGAVLRSRHGLLRRLTVLRALASGATAGTPHEAQAVWNAYGHDPSACAREAAAIAARELAWTASPFVSMDTVPRSHGPGPSFGSFEMMRDDGAAHVYLMELVADARWVELVNGASGRIIKLGRSNDIDRRCSELNDGFPPTIGLTWRVADTVTCEKAGTAHAIEQAMLDICEARGFCLGREFLSLAPDTARNLLREVAAQHVSSS